MTCSSCVAKVKSELLKIGDILSADVQLRSPQALLTMSRHIATARLQEAISKAGSYTIHEAGTTEGYNSIPAHQNGSKSGSYYPIFLIFGYIAGISLLLQLVSPRFDLLQWMRQFMAGFFLLFSFFKLLDIKAFSEAYRTYDIVARVFPAWGFVYPFAELSMGILFLADIYPLGINIATFLLMGIGSIGVIQSLVKKRSVQCACLGTIIKLPLSRVTLFEDLLMVVMSGIMIVMS